MKRAKEGYKVMSRLDRLESVFSPLKGTVEYQKGRTTRPRAHCGPLCVFEERNQAIHFAEMFKFARTAETWIAACVYIPVPDASAIFAPAYVGDGHHTTREELPAGTDLAAAVRITGKPWQQN